MLSIEANLLGDGAPSEGAWGRAARGTARIASLENGANLGRQSRVAIGSATAVVGLLLTVLSFVADQSWSVARFWPLLVVGFGASGVVDRPRRLEGWVLLVVGGVVQLSNLGVFALPGQELVRYWPLVVVVVGFSEMALSRSIPAIVEGFAIVCLGVWLELAYFGLAHISSYRPWPLVLAAVGGSMIWRGVRAGTEPPAGASEAM